MERIQTDDVAQFTSREFQGGRSVHGVQLALAATGYQETNGQVEVTWKELLTISYSLMYTTDHIFTFLPIKHLVNHNGEPTMPHKLETGAEYSV